MTVRPLGTIYQSDQRYGHASGMRGWLKLNGLTCKALPYEVGLSFVPKYSFLSNRIVLMMIMYPMAKGHMSSNSIVLWFVYN